MSNNNETQGSRLGSIFLIVGWVIFLGLVSLLVHQAIYAPKVPYVLLTEGGTEITLYRDRDSHFRIPGTINGIDVMFLIDTGATTIAMSDALAKEAKLSRQGQVITQTAAGQAIGHYTTISSLIISGIEFTDMTAIIVPEMQSVQALLGMNVLRHFSIQQDQEKLILTIPAAEL